MLLMKSYSVLIQMKATEQYVPVILFIMLYKVVLTFESVDEILQCAHSNGQYFPVVLFITLYKVVRTLEFVTQFQMKTAEQFVFHKSVVLRMKSV